MKKILVVSTLSLALLSGTAMAQVSIATDANGGLSVGVTGADGSSANVDANVGAAVDAATGNGNGSLGTDLGAGVGVAASDDEGNGVSAGAGADVGVAASSGNGNGSLNVGAAANADAAASSEDGDRIDAGAGAQAGVAANVDEDGVEAGADAAGSAAASAETEDEVDAQTTAAIDSSTQLGAAIQGLGEAGSAFFTDDSRTQVVAESEFRTAFGALSTEQQEQLRNACQGETQAGASAAFCTAVQSM